MHHETSLIATIAVGPSTPGFVADTKLAPPLAKIGVILLMFGVGMHFSLRDLLVVGTRIFPWILKRVENTRSRELFTLAVVALALGIAFGSAALFEVSYAMGAFFAGMVINHSDLSHRAAMDLLPFQDAFAALFFVSVGMLFEPAILLRHPLKLVAVVAIVLVGKSVLALGIVLALRYPMRSGLTVAGALLSITLNPLAFLAVEKWSPRAA